MPGTTQAAIELLTLESSVRVLDLGCYHGDVSKMLAQQGHQVASFDVVPYEGTKSLSEFRLGDANGRLPWDDGVFDAVLSTEVIEHLENPSNFVREIARVLKSGGVAVVSTPNIDSLFARIHYLLRGYFPTFSPAQYRSWGHISPVSVVWLQNAAQQNNLNLECITSERGPLNWRRKLMLAASHVIKLVMRKQPGLTERGHSVLVKLRKTA